jgi:xanthosine phosphorylase
MMTKDDFQPALDVIHKLAPGLNPKIGIILGSGLGPLADEIEDAVKIPYHKLPGMPVSSVKGHDGELILGHHKGVAVACLNGRIHFYEGATPKDFKLFIRLIKCLGCSHLIITNASGSLRKEIPAGELVLISDHINFQGTNPLIGENDDEFGPRFFPTTEAYDPMMRDEFKKAAKKNGITLHDGVYFSVMGPYFETAAEIRAFRTLGADVIGMSTVPDVLVALHAGLKVNVISSISNLSADMNDEPLSHEITLKYVQMASDKLRQLVSTFIADYGSTLE